MSKWKVVTVVKEQREYLIEAATQDEAQELALDGSEEPRSIDVLDEWVTDSADVSERDHDAERERDADADALEFGQPRIMAALKESLS